ncbi:hypothetical protein ACHWQZ_G013169 [Mnemiopsis leidyi]
MGNYIAKKRHQRRKSLKNSIYWKQWMTEYFKIVDADRDGYVTIEEMIDNIKPLQDYCLATPTKMDRLAAALTVFWGEVGLKPGRKVNKRMFLRGLNKLGRKELEREARGRPTLHSAVAHALFDIIDQNNNNQLTEIEIGNWMAASGLNPTDARRMMEEADKKKKGYISREELIESEFCSFFHPEKCMRQLGIRVV